MGTVLSLDSQIQAFAEIGKLELRLLQIEGLVTAIKHKCLVMEAGRTPELVSATAELRWQLGQVASHILDVERHLGIGGRGMSTNFPPPATTEQKQPDVLRGSTDTLAVPDLMNLLSNLKKTGTLNVRKDATHYAFEFLDGAIVHAVTNEPQPGMRLGTILTAQGKLTAEQLAASLTAIERSRGLLGAELVRTSVLSELDLRAALEIQVRMMFENVFALTSGKFWFVEGSVSNLGQRVSLNTTELLLETARRVDESRHHKTGPVAAKSDGPLPGVNLPATK